MDLLPICGAVILIAVLFGLVRQVRPEFALPVLLAGIALILLSITARLVGLRAELFSVLAAAGLDREGISILVRALGACVVSRLAADLCRDNASSSLATVAELAGRCGALLIALPLFQSALELAAGLIGGV